MQEIITTNILIVGAGPAGLAAALRLKRRLAASGDGREILVIDKSCRAGAMNLSGALVPLDVLDPLIDGGGDDRPLLDFRRRMVDARPEHDRLMFLAGKASLMLPTLILPPNLRHRTEALISVGELCERLEACCEAEGVGILHGVGAAEPVMHNGTITGVVVSEQGVGKDGARKSNYLPCQKITADLVLLADGAHGSVSAPLREAARARQGRFPQIHSIGLKELVRLTGKSGRLGRTVVHTLGYPLPPDVFGGGFVYGFGGRRAAVGIIIGLDWKYRDFDPQEQLALFKRHPAIVRLLGDHDVVCAGARVTPEGGYGAAGPLEISGALLLGDAAGFVNLASFKGVHLAVRSGVAAADAAADVLLEKHALPLGAAYRRALRSAGVITELYQARNFRQVFSGPLGLFSGAPLSLVQHAIPFTLPLKNDRLSTRPLPLRRKRRADPDKDGFVYYSGAVQPEDSASHIIIKDDAVCARCGKRYAFPCLSFCPGGVYERDPLGARVIAVRHVNCLHDKTCLLKCPFDNIEWKEPSGGVGPRYHGM